MPPSSDRRAPKAERSKLLDRPPPALTIHRAPERQPIAAVASLTKATRLTPATLNKSLAHLERIGVVEKLTSKRRGRVFHYARYTEILNEGMTLPKRQGRR